MKSRLLKPALLSLGAMIAAIICASHASAAATPGTTHPSGDQGRGPAPKGERAINPKIEAVLQESRATIKALAGNKALPAAEREARIEATHKSARERILPLLPKEEQEKFLRWIEQEGNTRFKQDPGYETYFKRRPEADAKPKK